MQLNNIYKSKEKHFSKLGDNFSEGTNQAGYDANSSIQLHELNPPPIILEKYKLQHKVQNMR